MTTANHNRVKARFMAAITAANSERNNIRTEDWRTVQSARDAFARLWDSSTSTDAELVSAVDALERSIMAATNRVSGGGQTPAPAPRRQTTPTPAPVPIAPAPAGGSDPVPVPVTPAPVVRVVPSAPTPAPVVTPAAPAAPAPAPARTPLSAPADDAEGPAWLRDAVGQLVGRTNENTDDIGALMIMAGNHEERITALEENPSSVVGGMNFKVGGSVALVLMVVLTVLQVLTGTTLGVAAVIAVVVALGLGAMIGMVASKVTRRRNNPQA